MVLVLDGLVRYCYFRTAAAAAAAAAAVAAAATTAACKVHFRLHRGS